MERAISLRSANVETVIEMRNCVNQTFLDLLKLMQSANVDISQIESATKNKQEFDTHVNNWIKFVTATPSFTYVPQASRAPSKKSIKSCSTSSSKSSSSSSKRREALVNYKLAVLKQKQAQERALEVAEQARQEAERKLAEQQRETERKLAEQQRETERKLAEQNRIQREAARELELAIIEMEVWETSSDILEKRYDKLKCDVPETVPGNTAGPSYNSQNDNQANISDATAPVVQTLSQTSLVGPAVATTIKSTNLVNATTQKYNPVPIAGPSSVIANPAIKTRHFPGQSPSLGLDLTDKSIRYPSNAENVNAPFILQPPPGFINAARLMSGGHLRVTIRNRTVTHQFPYPVVTISFQPTIAL